MPTECVRPYARFAESVRDACVRSALIRRRRRSSPNVDGLRRYSGTCRVPLLMAGRSPWSWPLDVPLPGASGDGGGLSRHLIVASLEVAALVAHSEQGCEVLPRSAQQHPCPSRDEHGMDEVRAFRRWVGASTGAAQLRTLPNASTW